MTIKKESCRENFREKTERLGNLECEIAGEISFHTPKGGEFSSLSLPHKPNQLLIYFGDIQQHDFIQKFKLADKMGKKLILVLVKCSE